MKVALCITLLAVAASAAYAQENPKAQFFILTENGNSFPIIGPPPNRPPGFDTAAYLEMNSLDGLVSISASDLPTVTKRAGPYITLPEHDPARASMVASLTDGSDWAPGEIGKNLYAPVLLGEIRMDGSRPYVARASGVGGLDILAHCNGRTPNGIEVRCISGGADSTAAPGNPSMLALPADERTVIFLNFTQVNTNKRLEIVFACPWCDDTPRAYVGYDIFRAPTDGARLYGPGFLYDGTVGGRVLGSVPNWEGSDYPKLDSGYPAAWGSVEHPRNSGVRYWAECTGSGIPRLSVVGTFVTNAPGSPCNAFTTLSPVNVIPAVGASPIYPGWSRHVGADGGKNYDMAIVVNKPGPGASLQMLHGLESIHVNEPHLFSTDLKNGGASRMVIHNDDLHLLVIPAGATIRGNDEVLSYLRSLQTGAMNLGRDSSINLLAHSDSLDVLQTGISYDGRGGWPPYKVMAVGATTINFARDSLSDQDRWREHLDYTTVSESRGQRDRLMQAVLRSDGPPAGLHDTHIYDIRNDKLLMKDRGEIILWDGNTTEGIHVEPHFRMWDSPLWDYFGVDMESNVLQVVDMYAVIPIVKPTHISGTYISSIPCGGPRQSDVDGFMDWLTTEAIGDPKFDVNLIGYYLGADLGEGISEDPLKQLIYRESRVYLDYLDGDYFPGARVNVPILAGMPYVCTIQAPNILESQYFAAALPLSASFINLGGQEFVADLKRFGASDLYDSKVVYTTGIQSPRDGVVVLDVASRFGAVFYADTTGGTGTPAPQWKNGTLKVSARMTVGGVGSVELARYELSLAGAEARPAGGCIGHFETAEALSGYSAKSFSFTAKRGEYVPVSISLSASGNLEDVGGTDQSCRIDWYRVQHLLRTLAVDVR